MAERLYGTGDWTMERIAKALGVSQATITRDLDGLCAMNKPRPKGGRRKGR
jgi:predicted DNA-binding transcriptional regulator YafY